MKKPENSPTLRYFGQALKALRTARGLSRTELGEKLGFSESMIGAVERGDRIPGQDFIVRADEVLEADGVLAEAAPFLAQERYPAWFADFSALEAESRALYAYDTHVLNGLLQTRDYAQVVIGCLVPPVEEEEIDRRVSARLERQELLTRRPSAVLSFVVEEWVLRRPVGGSKIMRAQLTHLVKCAEMRNVSIQVVPTRIEEHAGFDGPMTLLETGDHRRLAYLEGQGSSQLVTDQGKVSDLTHRYGTIRAQALTPGESAQFIEQLAGEL